MFNVSNSFKTAMESNIKSLAINLKYKDDNESVVTLTGDDAIISVKISSESELGSSAIRKAEVSLLNSSLPNSFFELGVEEYFTISYGVKTAEPSTWEYQYIGAFKISDFNYKEDDGTINIVAYDRMYDTMVDYVEKMPEPTFWSNDTNLGQYISNVLSKCGIPLGNSDFVHNEMKITSDRFVSKNSKGIYVSNLFGYKVRDLINDICKISGTMAVIRPYKVSSNPEVWEDRLYFRKLDVNTIDYNISSLGNLVSFKQFDRYGDINKVVFAREPQQDYISEPYSDTIDDFGVTEWKVDNNQLVDWQPIIDPNNPTLEAPKDNRSEYIKTTFLAICGAPEYPHSGAIYYYPFEAETVGYGWFEIGDRIRFANEDSFILSYSVTFDGGITERISSPKTNKTDTKVKYVSNKSQNQTQLVVDKQNQIIKQYVSQTEANSSTIKTFETTLKGFSFASTLKGGNNLLKNSVMRNNFIDNNSILQAKEWTRSNTGTLSISDIGKSRSTSGNQFTLDGEIVSQTVAVIPDNPYSFSFYVLKGNGLGYAKIYDGDPLNADTKVYTIDIQSDPIENYKILYKDEIKPLQPSLTIKLYGLLNSKTSFTDVILCKGIQHQDWSQAEGEISNDNVLIDNSGIIVKGEGKLSTTISSTEFSGKENGQTIFTLNNQTTIVNKLKAKEEINMPPLKIISLSQGWAIVRSE